MLDVGIHQYGGTDFHRPFAERTKGGRRRRQKEMELPTDDWQKLTGMRLTMEFSSHAAKQKQGWRPASGPGRAETLLNRNKRDE